MAQIELMFVEDHLKKLKEMEDRYVENMSSYVLEPQVYAQNVGSILAIREIRNEFLQLLKNYFPENYDRKRKQ